MVSTRRKYRTLDGVLLFDKPPGISSNGALQRVRRLYGAARAGHTGTLDPFATGLLPIAFGEATKFSAGLLEADKTYLARLQLGVRTSTGDPEGEIIETREVDVEPQQIARVLTGFTGVIEQIPPMHSALKHAGRPLYEYARKGQQIDRAARRVVIHQIELLECADHSVTVRVRCSKGTYIRVLAEDIGVALGCGAHLGALRRLAVGGLDVAAAYRLDQLESLSEEARDARLLAADTLVRELPRAVFDDAAAARLLLGQAVHPRERDDSAPLGSTYRAYSESGTFLGLVTLAEEGYAKPQRLMSVPPR